MNFLGFATSYLSKAALFFVHSLLRNVYFVDSLCRRVIYFGGDGSLSDAHVTFIDQLNEKAALLVSNW